MAIPVRLVLGDGRGKMDLFTTSIDVNIGRNVQQFPTPDLMAGRIGIDLNTPEIKIDLQGILYDDDFQINGDTMTGGTNPVEQRSDLVTAINFNSIIPSDKGEFDIAHVPTLGTVGTDHYMCAADGSQGDYMETTYNVAPDLAVAIQGQFIVNITRNAGTNVITADMVEFMDQAEDPILTTNAKVDGWSFTGTRAALSYSSASTSVIKVDAVHSLNGVGLTNNSILRPSFVFKVGDRIVKEDGTLIGTVASTDDANETVTFTTNIATPLIANFTKLFKQVKLFDERNNDLGYVTSIERTRNTQKCTIVLNTAIPVGIREGDKLFLNGIAPIEELLDGEAIKLFPSAWLENPLRSYAGHSIQEDEDMITNAGIQGIRLTFDGTTNISVDATRVRKVGSVIGNPGDANYDNGDAEVSIPIKGLTDEDNPAQALAQKIVDSLNLFSHPTIFRNNSKMLLKVPANVHAPSHLNPVGTSSFHPQMIFASPFFEMTAAYVNNFLQYEAVRGVLLLKQVYTPSTEIAMPNPLTRGLVSYMEVVQTTNYTMHGGPMSAGDKVQNLMAMVSNASKNIDLIRGIQIPYNSLVTSPNINGTTRNFFTTFGQVDPDSKVSTGNELVASAPMTTMEYNSQMVGGQSPPAKKTLLDTIGDFGNGPIGTIMNFLVNTADTIWTTLTTESHGNINGMNVIPNKLHVRYDAGNNYYAFNLELLATDFIIGV